MPRPTTRSGEKAQWEAAARLLDQHGNDVGDFIFAQIKATLDEGDRPGCAIWLQIAEKVERLREAEDPAQYQ